MHSLTNISLIAYTLETGGGDFDRSNCLTMMGGWDTDSDGARVGAVTGALAGADGIAAQWTDPLRGRLVRSIPDAGDLTFDLLTDRTLAVSHSVQAVADRAGFSIASVPQVLNGKLARRDTEDRVRAAVAERGYVPEATGPALKLGSTMQVAFAFEPRLAVSESSAPASPRSAP